MTERVCCNQSFFEKPRTEFVDAIGSVVTAMRRYENVVLKEFVQELVLVYGEEKSYHSKAPDVDLPSDSIELRTILHSSLLDVFHLHPQIVSNVSDGTETARRH